MRQENEKKLEDVCKKVGIVQKYGSRTLMKKGKIAKNKKDTNNLSNNINSRVSVIDRW